MVSLPTDSIEEVVTTHEHHLKAVPSSIDEKRMRRKKKSPANFRLNKQLVRAETTQDVLDIIGENLSDFNIVNIGTALYRLALVGGNLAPLERDSLRSDNRFLDLIIEIVDTLQGDSASDSLQQVVLAPKELSNIIWAATKLGLSDSNLFEAVAKHVVRHISHFDSVNLSLTLWGFAKMNQNAPAMFEASRQRIIELLPEFEPHRICNTVWAYAKTGNTDLELFRLIADESLRKLHRFNHSNESMLLYSYALGHVHAPSLFKRAMSQQLPGIKSGEVQDPRSLSNLVWAISELMLQDEFRALYDYVARSAIENIHRYSLTHMATIASAYAKAGIRSDDLFRLIVVECNNRPINDPSLWADLLILNESLTSFGLESGVVGETVEKVKTENSAIEQQDRRDRIRTLMVDLVNTSFIAAAVLLCAALLRIYFSSRS
jgi:hypothetical protein